MAGVNVPLHASEHFYIVTEPMTGVARDLPVLRDTDGYIYVREEVGGLLMGGFEPVGQAVGHGRRSRPTSSSRCCPRTGTTSACSWSRRACASPRSRRRPCAGT